MTRYKKLPGIDHGSESSNSDSPLHKNEEKNKEDLDLTHAERVGLRTGTGKGKERYATYKTTMYDAAGNVIKDGPIEEDTSKIKLDKDGRSYSTVSEGGSSKYSKVYWEKPKKKK